MAKPVKTVNATVEPLLEVNGQEVRTFDKAWKLSQSLPRPVHGQLLKWVRKD